MYLREEKSNWQLKKFQNFMKFNMGIIVKPDKFATIHNAKNMTSFLGCINMNFPCLEGLMRLASVDDKFKNFLELLGDALQEQFDSEHNNGSELSINYMPLDEDGNTLLHYAAMNAHNIAALQMIDGGEDPEHVNGLKQTTYFLAELCGNKEYSELVDNLLSEKAPGFTA